MTTYLSREDILKAQDFRTDEVDIEEWGGTVLVRELSAAESEKIGFGMADQEGNIDLRKAEGMAIRIAALGVIDKNHKRVFTKADVTALGKHSRSAITRVAKRILQLTGLVPEPDEDEDTESKNE